MPAFSLRSRRKATGRARLAVVAALVPALVVGCSLVAPATVTPAQSVAAATDLPSPTIAPTATPAATPSAEPSVAPPAPSLPPAAVWQRIGHALTAPAAWLDFGFASNGDVLAIGTRDARADPLRLFVARFTPSGRKRSEHGLSRSVTPIAGDWASIDPTDSSIVVDDYNRSTFSFSLRRFSSSTGFNVSNAVLPSGINRIVIDGRGRQFGLPQYGVDGNAYAAIVRLDLRSRLRAGVDYWLRPLDAGPRPDRPPVLAYPTAIAVGRDSRVIVVDAPDVDATYPDGTPRRAAVVTSLTPSLTSPRQWELPVEWPLGSPAFGTWSHRLSIAGAADGSLYVGEPILHADGTTVTGWRVRHFGPDGQLIEGWGPGTSGAGVLGPNHPNLDADGRLWVIDTDPATGTSVIAVLSLAA
ncbi:MAG TPA: hypothetical protein VL749_06710 [Patescibacteria group bacterium]|nr:hypothetical protein [Patescibacteria group bacterium]